MDRTLVVTLTEARGEIVLEPGVDREQLDWMLSVGRVIERDGRIRPVARRDVAAVEVAPR